MFTLVGLSAWAFLQAAMTVGTSCVITNVAFVRFTPCPRPAFPLAAIIASLPSIVVTATGAVIAAAVTGHLSGHENRFVRVPSGSRLTVRLIGTGALWENAVGQAGFGDGLRARAFSVAAPATCPVALRARIRLCRLPAVLPSSLIYEEGGACEVGRAIGLDVHLRFLRGRDLRGRRGPLGGPGEERRRRRLKVLAESLLPTDRVALEVTGRAWEIVADPRAARREGVVVVSPADTGIAQARAKTDRLDARTLARLLWAG